MRLTCPNCGAEYEVPDEVIPVSGRDVQCSNCGDTWYQYHPDNMPEGSEDDSVHSDQARAPEPAPQPMPDTSAEPDSEPEPDSDDLADEDDDEDDDDDDPPSDRLPPKRKLAPEVQNILREEAEYEERARGQDPLESQPDLGLGEPSQARREEKADDRLSRLRESRQDADHPSPESHAAVIAAADSGSSRRNLLPDIEEINSTLRRKGDSMRGSSGRTARGKKAAPRTGARRSFMSVLILLAVAATIYLQAPKIGAAIPQLSGPMETYVEAVDRARIWLDEKASALAQKLDDMAAEDSEDGAASDSPPEETGSATD